tara:strand:- start:1078 stop:2223 length:1146 start_codon:yes stop_codon:yes gene_type:complete
MKTKLYLIINIVLFSTCSLNAQNITYQSWGTRFYATSNSCTSEIGDEEYTWYGYMKDNVYTSETSTGCYQKTVNGSTSLAINSGLRTRNNTTATQLIARVRAWEDDGGNRCSYDTGINSDDCSTNISETYNFANPVEYQQATVTRNVGNGNFNMDLTFTYRYSVELLDTAIENTTETFIASGDRPFWGAKGSWANDGIDCAASGTITHNQSSIFKTTVTDKSSVTFEWRVSSEANDYLQVYVNDVLDEQISGNTNWATKTINLTESVNTIQWQYKKDSSGSGGLDRGFVDAISFEDAPALSINSNNLDFVSIYPNPVKSILNIKGLKNDNYNLDIYNVLGKKVKTIKNIQGKVDFSSLRNGFYMMGLYTNSSYRTFKILKQ